MLNQNNKEKLGLGGRDKIVRIARVFLSLDDSYNYYYYFYSSSLLVVGASPSSKESKKFQNWGFSQKGGKCSVELNGFVWQDARSR